MAYIDLTQEEANLILKGLKLQKEMNAQQLGNLIINRYPDEDLKQVYKDNIVNLTALSQKMELGHLDNVKVKVPISFIHS